MTLIRKIKQSMRCSAAILILAFPLSGCNIVRSSSVTESFYLPERNLLSVRKTNLIFTDKVRNQKLPLQVVYPASSDKPNPIIIFSYGYQGAGEQDKALADYWTSHGYVVITPAHNDSSYKNPNSDYRGLDSKLLWENRIKDINFVIDSLNEIEQALPKFKGVLDRENIALAGFSLGAHTTSLMAGATVTSSAKKDVSYQNNRITAFLALSPQGRGSWTGFQDNSWDKLNNPIMFVTGSLDTQTSLGEPDVGPEWRAEGYTFSPPGDKYYFCIEGFSHMDFDGSEPEQGKRYKTIYTSLRSVTLSFFDAYLRNSQAAKDYLAFNTLAEETDSIVRLQLK